MGFRYSTAQPDRSGADVAVIVTNGRVTASAVAFAKQQRLLVVDRHTLGVWASGSRPLGNLLRVVPAPSQTNNPLPSRSSGPLCVRGRRCSEATKTFKAAGHSAQAERGVPITNRLRIVTFPAMTRNRSGRAPCAGRRFSR